MELEADEGGVVTKLHVAAGSDGVKVGTLIATIAGEGDDTSATPAPAAAAAPGPAKPSAPTPAQASDEADAVPADASPVAVKPKAGDAPASLSLTPDTPGPTHRQTVREALRDAMAEEMRDRPDRLRHGRGGRRVSGRVQGHAGPARRVRPGARRRHADHRIRLRRPRHRRGDGRAQADRRVHDVQLRDAGDRPHHQLGRQDQLHERRPDALPDRLPRPQRRGEPRRGAAQPELRPVVRERPRPDRHRALRRARRPRGCSSPRSARPTRSSSSRTNCSTATASTSPTATSRWKSARRRSSARART